jgi:prepilin-type N-terminal cleavage/methylation domain-containing protein
MKAATGAQLREQRGFSMLEYIVALIIVGVGLVCWLDLCVTGVKNGAFVRKLDDIKWSSGSKAVELLKQADTLAGQIPLGQQTIGSIAPAAPLPGFYDELNEAGWLIRAGTNGAILIDPAGNQHQPKSASDTVVRFVRQWQVVRDLPNKGEISIYVSLVYLDSNQIMRIAKVVKTDGIESTTSPTP